MAIRFAAVAPAPKAKPGPPKPPKPAKAKHPGGRPKADMTKVPISIRLDTDLLDHYRATGDGWQSRINDDLRKAAGLK